MRCDEALTPRYSSVQSTEESYFDFSMQWKDEVVLDDGDHLQIDIAYHDYQALDAKEKDYLIQIKGM